AVAACGRIPPLQFRARHQQHPTPLISSSSRRLRLRGGRGPWARSDRHWLRLMESLLASESLVAPLPWLDSSSHIRTQSTLTEERLGRQAKPPALSVSPGSGD